MNHQIHSTTGESPYCVVFKQKMQMQHLSFADRAIAIPGDKNEELDKELDEELDEELDKELDEEWDGSESDATGRNREFGNDSELLADDREYDSEQSNGAPCYTSEINTHEGTGKAMAKALLRSLPHNDT